MRRQLLVLLCTGFLATAIGILFSGLFPSVTYNNWFLWPFILLAITCLFAAAVGLARPTHQQVAFWVSDFSCFGLLPAMLFAAERWTTGDHGSALGWGLLAGSVGVITFVLAPAIAVVEIQRRPERRRAARRGRAAEPAAGAADRDQRHRDCRRRSAPPAAEQQ
ncbi:MAG: hypothetical protein FJ265_10230 [Planctomycetes bacterium]|nr:hypothetical protein [Planctomycetota bacterium]